MEIFVSMIIGYLLGSLSPAEAFSRLKKVDLKGQGTKNLGATNSMLVLGKSYGALVLAADIAKAFAAAQIAKWLFPKVFFAGVLAGIGAIIGHIFPLYLGFHGGKGLAAFGGTVLAYDPRIFVILLITGAVLMVVFNYGVALPISAALLFPILVLLFSKNIVIFLLAAAAGGIIIVANWSNVKKARVGEAIKVREYIKEHMHA